MDLSNGQVPDDLGPEPGINIDDELDFDTDDDSHHEATDVTYTPPREMSAEQMVDFMVDVVPMRRPSSVITMVSGSVPNLAAAYWLQVIVLLQRRMAASLTTSINDTTLKANIRFVILSPAKSLQATLCVGFAVTFVGDGYTLCTEIKRKPQGHCICVIIFMPCQNVQRCQSHTICTCAWRICRQPWGNQAMIQCEFCLRWYHCSCVGLPDDICNDKYHESDIVYFCSIDKCNSGIPHCSVKGNNIVVGSAVCDAVLTSRSVNNDSVPVSSVLHSDLKPVVSVSGNYSVPVSSTGVSGVSVCHSFGQSNGDFNLDNCVESILHCPLPQAVTSFCHVYNSR